MNTAVIYARYSSSSQTEQSIEGQLRVCREYAERNNITILDEYIDRAMTGTNDNRPSFQKMINESEKKEFNYVLVYKLDRFSRNKYDNAIYKHKLQQNNVRVISATEVISDSPEGVIMEGLLEMFAELYSKDLSQKVKRGIRENRLKGLYSGGTLPFGYKAINKKIMIDEENLPAVKMIFELYANGISKTEIVNILNEKGYKTNRNHKFTLSSLETTISNRKYIGEYKDQYIESNTFFPAIIDKELFEKAQLRAIHNKKKVRQSKADYLLSGKLYCGHCGESMDGVCAYNGSGKKFYYYACINKIRKHNCKKANIQKEKIEEKILSKIKKEFFNEKKLEEIAEGILKESIKQPENNEIERYSKLIEQIDRKLDNITEQVIENKNKEIISRLTQKANDLTEEKENYQIQIKKLKAKKTITRTKETIIESLKMMIDGDDRDINYKKKIIDKFVNAIYLFDDYIYINFEIDKTEPITLKEVKEQYEKYCSNNKCQSPPKIKKRTF